MSSQEQSVQEVNNAGPDGGQTPPGGSVAAPPNGRKKAKRIVLAVLAVVAVIGGTVYYLNSRAYETTDDAQIEGHLVAISPKVAGLVAKVCVTDNQPVHEGDVLVEIDPRDFEATAAQAQAALESAEARKRAANMGLEMVTVSSKGDVDVAAAGIAIAKSAVASSEAQVAAAKSRLEQAKAATLTALATVEQKKADVVASAAEANRTQSDFGRYRQLMETGSATSQQLDNASAACAEAGAKLEVSRKAVSAAEAQAGEARAAEAAGAEGVKQAEAMLTQAQSSVGEAEARLAQVSVAPQRVEQSTNQRDSVGAEIRQLAANLNLAQLQLSYTKIVAPQSGRVTRKAVEEGAYVQVGQPMLAIVPEEMWVVADFKETQLTLMRPGQPVSISVDAYPDLQLTGRVESIQRGTGARFSLLPPENATGNFVKVVQRVPVKILFDSIPQGPFQLGPGMSVIAKVKVR